ncbi:hypothetical protein LJR129_004712 [Acidovorax sp. LjRoot129]|uniref:hypothetical protein n=1 Tax=Acidovorax sp. LjRoot129 TaxID=3342260 RepID=UPI003ECE2E91
MKSQRAASPASPVQGFWRTALVALAVAAGLAGCSRTSSSARSSDPATQQPQKGASGVTVFGDIDVNVTRERSR